MKIDRSQLRARLNNTNYDAVANLVKEEGRGAKMYGEVCKKDYKTYNCKGGKTKLVLNIGIRPIPINGSVFQDRPQQPRDLKMDITAEGQTKFQFFKSIPLDQYAKQEKKSLEDYNKKQQDLIASGMKDESGAAGDDDKKKEYRPPVVEERDDSRVYTLNIDPFGTYYFNIDVWATKTPLWYDDLRVGNLVEVAGVQSNFSLYQDKTTGEKRERFSLKASVVKPMDNVNYNDIVTSVHTLPDATRSLHNVEYYERTNNLIVAIPLTGMDRAEECTGGLTLLDNSVKGDEFKRKMKEGEEEITVLAFDPNFMVMQDETDASGETVTKTYAVNLHTKQHELIPRIHGIMDPAVHEKILPKILPYLDNGFFIARVDVENSTNLPINSASALQDAEEREDDGGIHPTPGCGISAYTQYIVGNPLHNIKRLGYPVSYEWLEKNEQNAILPRKNGTLMPPVKFSNHVLDENSPIRNLSEISVLLATFAQGYNFYVVADLDYEDEHIPLIAKLTTAQGEQLCSNKTLVSDFAPLRPIGKNNKVRVYAVNASHPVVDHAAEGTAIREKWLTRLEKPILGKREREEEE